ncbi:arabinosyltransferase domain-containing protein [Allosaccharopolyspora coralli]|uniref:arabinosyltransferase domain-containing protein n=1 Tax=Allosaccharopolyspora coralli TaxID=2665642 RepID=UPI002B403C22|nr:arabinosyltransferase domain-containing protein [Allosaccharopolyspora coralli]
MLKDLDDGEATGGHVRRPVAEFGHRVSGARRVKIWAVVCGVLGTLLSLAVPFLPVHHEITTLKWPTAQGTAPVAAPLVSYSPLWLSADVPCATARDATERSGGSAVLLSTNPPESQYGNLTGLSLQTERDRLDLRSRGQQLGSVSLPPGDCLITIRSDGERTTASVDQRPFATVAGDQRPQLTGIYSDVDGAADDVRGLSFEARVDNRFDSTATVLKVVVMVLAVVAFVGAACCVRLLDARAGRRPPRLAPRGWWKPTSRDLAVYGAIVVWWLIGAMTSDDGYILSIARSRESAGFVSNYYRWFANPEAPWGWFYEIYTVWVQVSTATLWVRMPALLMAIASWLLISREVLPRLGQKVRRSGAAGWAAAAVFLAFWLPYNNGLRPEPVVVVFSLLTLCAVERAVATRRLLPAALGLVGAALAVGANPHGLVAVLPYLAAIKPLSRLLRDRARQFGWLPVLAPLSACGFVILTAVYSDQTWRSVLDGIELKTTFGPSDNWYEELIRYNLLFSFEPDGSLSRRFPVLLVMLCLVTCAVVLLRRGRIHGAALGPSRRLLAVTAMSFVVLAMTMTKWTHHFGIFAAVGGALAALTALATSSTVLRSKRNRAAFFAGLMLISALSATGTNGWWYVSGWGVPWFDKPPSIEGYNASTALLVGAAVAGIVAVIEHVRLDERRTRLARTEKSSRALRLGTAPLAIICALLVVGEIAAFGKAVHEQRGSYSLGADNVRQLLSSSCGLSDYVDVEMRPRDGLLPVSANQPTQVAPGTEIPRGAAEEDGRDGYLRPVQDGFSRPGLPPGDGSDPLEPDWEPPHQFGDDEAPVWGSYDPNGSGTAELRTQWYDLPEKARSGASPLVVSMAGAEAEPNSVVAEFGRDTARGFEITHRETLLMGPPPEWRDARVTVPEPARGADRVRLVVDDQALGMAGWLAVSAPRVPQLQTMAEVLGDEPTFVEWPAAFVHPCANLSGIGNGIAEVPKFRVVAGAELRGAGESWSSPDAGGPFGWMNVTTTVRELPTYLQGDIKRDWGTLYAVDPVVAEALPAETAVVQHRETHGGLWSPGRLSLNVQLPGDVPSSADRDTQGASTNQPD